MLRSREHNKDQYRFELRSTYTFYNMFLDISGAFDNVKLSSATKGMKRVKIPPIIRAWYTDYLYNRVAHASVKGCTASRKLNKGTPQGGVISPLLWNIDFDNFLYQ